MGCNCGGAKNSTQQWVYSGPNGTVVYKTEIEARAAKIRNGNQGTITVKAA